MRSEYKRDVHNNYLVLENDKKVEETSYPVRMLLANALPLFLKCRLQGMDGKMLFYYEITSRQSLEDLYEKKKFSFEDLQLLFGNFVGLIEKMAEYLLNPDQLVLEPEFIFLDVEKKNMYFCYLPGYERPIRDQFQSLTEYVLPKLNHEDDKAVMLGYGIYRHALEEVFQLEHIKEEVYHSKSEETEKIKEKKPEDSFMYIPQSENRKEEKKEMIMEQEEEVFSWQRGTNAVKPVEKESPSWIKALIFIGSCLLAAGVLVLLILAQNKGYIPNLGVEFTVGIVIIFITFLAFIGYLLHRTDKKEPEILKKVNMIEEEQKKIYVSTGKDEYERNKWESHESGRIQSEKVMKVPERRKDLIHKVSSVRNGDYGETVILSEEPVKGPATLVSREPGALATIYLQDELTVIGKMESAADAVVDLPTVSRLHAKIRRRGEDYYLTDLNSRNGTAVNGRMLKADEEYLLQEEDEVDFAQARYIFLK